MSNAAYRLADLLEQWHVPKNTSPESLRGFDSSDNVRQWRDVLDAADTVRVVDRTLQGMAANGENIAMFESTLPKWYAGVYMAKTPWGVTNNTAHRRTCEPIEIDLLRALGALIDTGNPIPLTEEDRRSLEDILTEAQDLLEADSSDLPQDVRRYLWSLVVRARTILDSFEKFGHEGVRQIALELGGAMTAQAERLDQTGNADSGRRWRSIGIQLLVGFLGGAGSTAGQAALESAGHVAKAITS